MTSSIQTDFESSDVKQGMKVRSRDGDDLGKITSCDATGFIIEKGFFFPKERRAPYAAVTEVRNGEVWLTYNADELRSLEDSDAYETHEAQEAQETQSYAGNAPLAADDIDLRRGEQEEQRLPLVEEKLDVEKRTQSAGEVRITKDVNEELKQVTVPVTKEDVVIERVPAGARDATEAQASMSGEQEVRIPLQEEALEVSKRPVVTEELRVKKVAKTEDQTVSEPVRKETARIETTGDGRTKP